MAPKKSKQNDWNECIKCKRVVYKKDIPLHTSDCCAAHGFVLNQVFHALVCVPNQQTTDVRSKLSLQEQDSVILVNVSVMRLCNLAIGYPCLVNESHILKAWPSEDVLPTSVLLPSHLANVITGSLTGTDTIITVRRFIPPSGSEAQKVNIEMELESEEFFTDEFMQLLKHKMEGRYISEGMRQAVHYFGRMCFFHIMTATPLQYPRYEMDTSAAVAMQSLDTQSDSSELHRSLVSMDISCVSDSGDSSLNESLSATPLKQTGRDRISEDSPSPVCRTPEQMETQRPEQFCTPVINRNQQQQQASMETPKFLKVVPQTQFVICRRCDKGETHTSKQKVTFDALGGLDLQISKIKEYCRLLLQNSVDTIVPRLPHGILLFGPTGTGKSLLAEATSNELGIYTTYISPVNIFSKFLGETEKKLRSIFEGAYQRSPSLIIVDNIDVLCLGQDLAQSDLEKRTVNTFLSLMDGVAKMSSRAACIVIGITSKPDLLDPRLRRASRFGMEIETGVPTAEDRLQILKKVLKDTSYCVSDADLKVITDTAHGFVGSDLAGVVNKAKQLSWERTQDKVARLSKEDLMQAAMMVKPSALREVQFEVPKVQWSDIGGQKEVKLKLRQAVEWPLTHPEAFHRMGIKPPCGCLMYGPPGCSKTMIAKALATESGINFLAVKGPELFGKYVGESERAVREIFRKARSAAPSIIFFDEIDSLAVERGKSSGGSNVADRVLTQLLTEMDGVVELKGVTVVAATNRPDMIDKALLRPGRFDRILYVPLPDDATRKEILQIVTRKTPVAPDVCLEDLVSRTKGFSGAELTALCHEAGLCAITESREARLVHMHHFEEAFKSVQPQTTQEIIKFYEDYCHRSRNELQIV